LTFNFFPAEEPEAEDTISGVDKLNDCESMQNLGSDENDFNSYNISSMADAEGSR